MQVFPERSVISYVDHYLCNLLTIYKCVKLYSADLLIMIMIKTILAIMLLRTSDENIVSSSNKNLKNNFMGGSFQCETF